MNKKLFKASSIALVGGALLALSSVSVAGIANTKHNLGTGGTGTNHLTTGTAEICVFCHTPHAADNTASVPLWNKNLDATGFTTYDSLGTSSLDGAIVPVGSVSVACLSCHDGSQAMDTMINAPGSGGYTAGGARPAGYVWVGAAQDGLLPTGVANLGKDLTNDHPVGVQYGGGGIDSTNPGGTTNDPDFIVAQHRTVNTNEIWWVDTVAAGGTSGSREKTDMQLYTRAADGSIPGANTGEPFVECASCHDPHTEANPTFLRISNDGSAVCLACHTK